MKKSQQFDINYNKALSGIFPNIECFYFFKDNDSDISKDSIPKIIEFAFKNKLIKSKTEQEFISFINQNSEDIPLSPQEDFSFENLIQLCTKEQSVNNFIKKINEIAEIFNMPEVQASLITRLKKDFHPNTPVKRNFLRLLAFWLCGVEQHDLIWNYQVILDLPRNIIKEMKNIAQGVRMGFFLKGQEANISNEEIKWLKNELNTCIDDMELYALKNQIEESETIMYLDLPKKKGGSQEPRFYEKAIHNSIALAHQITIRWALTKYSSPKKNIIIAIAAGDFVNINTQIQSLLDVNVPDDHTIRLTSFAYLCAKIADVRALYFKDQNKLETGKNNNMFIYSINNFWTYYDYILDLLNDDMLPTNQKAYNRFKNILYYPHEYENQTDFKALIAINKLPQNSLLIIEVAKICFFRKMFNEANILLSMILVSKPNDIVARTFRMRILLNLALEQSKFSVFELFYKRAINEGFFIKNNCKIEDDVFWCDFGIIYYGIAVKLLQLIRKNDRNVNNTIIIECLEKAKNCFDQGMVFSTTGLASRPMFWLLHTKCLIKLLVSDNEFFTNKKPLRDYNQIYSDVVCDCFLFFGWGDYNTNRQDVLKRMFSLANKYQNTVISKNYIPNVLYALASFLFDFNPILDVYIIKSVINFLKQSRDVAKKLHANANSVYSIAGTFAEIQPSNHFIDCINETIKKIELYVGNDLKLNDDHQIDKKKLKGLKLMLLHIEKDIPTDVLVH